MKERGMTLMEILVALTIFVLIGLAFSVVLVFHQKSFVRENKRVLLQTQLRTGLLYIGDKLMSAGAGIGVACTQSYMGSGSGNGLTQGTCSFRGIIPLNNSNGPDGLILAYGNTSTLTRLAPTQSSWNPSNTSLALEKVLDTSQATPVSMWNPNDLGMVMSSDGFYIFRVVDVDVDNATLQIRPTPVYYSGLLNFSRTGEISISYTDQLPTVTNYSSPQTGDTITYFRNTSVVIKLDFFAIFFVDKIPNTNSYYLVASLDTMGSADPCSGGVASQKCVPLGKNIIDLQVEYFEPSQGKVYCSKSSDIPQGYTAEECNSFQDLYQGIITKTITGLRLSLAGVTEQFTKKYQKNNYLILPLLGDRVEKYLNGEPWVKMKLDTSMVTISPRNMFIVY